MTEEKLKEVLKKTFKNKKILIILIILIVIFVKLAVANIYFDKSKNRIDYMLSQRYGFTATLLKDGTVLIAGGEESKYPNKAEIYNPKTHESHYVGGLNIRRSLHKAILLDDGRVLIVGGLFNPSQAELYNPKTGKFALTGKLTPNLMHDMINLVKLEDGRVLAFCDSIIEIYNPKTGNFKFVAKSPYNHFEDAVVLLKNGNVIILGRQKRKLKKNLYADESSIIYNPKTNKFIKGPEMIVGRRNPKVVTLKDGKILVLGGEKIDGTPIQLAEIYDPKTNKFYNAGLMKKNRAEFTPIVLQNDNIYIPSGDHYNFNDLGNLLVPLRNSCEIYNTKKKLFKYTNICTEKLKYEYNAILLNNHDLLIISGGTPRSKKKERKQIEIINTEEVR